MNCILFDDQAWNELLPLTFTRPVAEIRIGILTIKEKWDIYFNTKCSYLTQEYLSQKYTLVTDEENLLFNGSVLPNEKMADSIDSLNFGECLVCDDIIIAAKLTDEDLSILLSSGFDSFNKVIWNGQTDKINKSYDIFMKNHLAIEQDFELLTDARVSEPLSETVNVIGRDKIFLEKGAKVEFATLNATDGPIYIGKDAEIMEGVVVRGPLAMCEHSQLKMSAKVYGATTLGPYCKCGGELNNVVMFAYSNKAHDGFLGNSVVGEWCNFGADTNNSNLKSTYSNIDLWNYTSKSFEDTQLLFCGCIVGDHSKFGINTMINTGSIIGVSASVYGAGFPSRFIPSFSRGGVDGLKEYSLEKLFQVADQVMKRRNKKLSVEDKKILEFVFEISKNFKASSVLE